MRRAGRAPARRGGAPAVPDGPGARGGGRRDADRAAAIYRDALALDPDFVPALRSLRETLRRVGRDRGGAPARGARGDARPRRRRRERSRASSRNAHSRRATRSSPVPVSREALALDAEDERALLGLPRSLEASGRLNEAVMAWQRAATQLGGTQRSAATPRARRAAGRSAPGRRARTPALPARRTTKNPASRNGSSRSSPC